MPLNILWTQSIFQLLPKVGPRTIVLWLVSSVSLAITLGFISVWAWREHRVCSKMLKKRPMRPLELQLARAINFFPLPICAMAFATMMYPALAYSADMVAGIFTAVIMGGLVQYIMLAFGNDYSISVLLNETPLKKWWYPSYCGGSNDMLPGLGPVWSREEHQIRVLDIKRSIGLVEAFMYIFVITSVIVVSNSIIPTAVFKSEDGYCHTNPVYPKSMGTTMVILQVLSTFIGSAGFSIISAAAHHSFTKLDEDGDYNFQKKAWAAFFFLQLPLLKVVLSYIPMALPASNGLSIPTAVTVSTQQLPDGKFTTSGEMISCPIFDQEVCVPMLYNCLVTVAMAYLSYWQFRIYKPGQTFDDLRMRFIKVYGEIPLPVKDDSSSEEDDEEEDDSDALC